MTKKSRSGLGSGIEDMTRGIDRLYGSTQNNPDSQEQTANSGFPLMISIDKISINPDQPRKYFNALELTKLSDSIKAKGIIEPLVVRINTNNNDFQLLAGHRRLIAAKQAGLKEVPITINNTPDDPKERLIIAMVENILRENLNPIEEAEGFFRLEKEFSQDVLAMAKLFGKDRTTIVNSIRLLELPDIIKEDIKTGVLTAGHGRAILSIQDQSNRLEARNIIIQKSLTVRETEKLSKKINLANKKESKDKPDNDIIDKSDFYNSLSVKLSEHLAGMNVLINNKGSKKKIEIYYNNNEDIEKIIKILGITI